METMHIPIADDGDIPNNSRLPLLVYKGVVAPGEGDAEAALEALFHANGWGNGWRGQVIYPYHHYHAEAHEAVGVGSGTARIQFGGPEGPILDVAAGDAVLIPAGVGHCCLEHADGFSVCGAYPPGQSPDVRRQGEPGGEAIRAAVAAVPLPQADPVTGKGGPMAEHWIKG